MEEDGLKARWPVSRRVPNGNWNPDNEKLNFNSNTRDNRNDDLGCRLAGSLLRWFKLTAIARELNPATDHFSRFLQNCLRLFISAEFQDLYI
ncbi:MAG: hypothetical protein HW401_839 [Parcubacteria group bacterium]|nr:hypothetical protein [Parcubacteria group bacterium]